MCPKPKVVRVDTFRIVAGMANFQPIWYFPFEKLVGDSMSVAIFSAPPDASIWVSGKCITGPVPTSFSMPLFK
jgi:hypothetical protein